MGLLESILEKLGREEDIDSINITSLLETNKDALFIASEILSVSCVVNKDAFEQDYNADFSKNNDENDEAYENRLNSLNEAKIIPATKKDTNQKIMLCVDPTSEVMDKYSAYQYGIITLSTYRAIIGSDTNLKLSFNEEEGMPSFIERMFKYCNDAGATDIDITTMQSSLSIKLKVSGEWTQQIGVLPITYKNKFLISLGSLASPSPIDYRSGKELKFRIGMDIDGINTLFRIAVFPTTFGENIAIRKLPVVGTLPNIRNLNLSEEAEEFMGTLVNLINSPKKGGLVLITGETGSGKSTLLSAQVVEYLKLSKKVSTSEDPVENKQAHPFLNQTEVGEDAGITHMDALAGFLRQNSDVIIIGETRRSEEFLAVINAALSGHFTYTTYHTGSVEDTLLRLSAMGIDLNLVAGTLKAIISTNLIPKLCESCKVSDGNGMFIRNTNSSVVCPTCRGKGVGGVIPLIEAAPFLTTEVKRVISSQNMEHAMEVISKQKGYISMSSQLERLQQKGLVDARMVI